MMIPQLRFPEFADEWHVKKLGEMADFARGKILSKDDLETKGKYKAIHYGQLFTEYDEVIKTVKSYTNADTGTPSQIGDILMPTSDVTPQGLARASVVHEAGVMLGGDINIVRPKNSIDSNFLSYMINFQKKKIIRIVSGTTVRHVYASDISKIQYTIPSRQEQDKIAEFLTAIDERMARSQKKLELLKQYKKGMMQKIFTQQIRFKDKNGNNYPDWEMRGFDHALTSIPSKNYQIQSTEYSDNGVYPVVDQGQKLIIGYSSNQRKVFKDVPVIVFGDHTTIIKYVDFDFIIGADGTKVLKPNNSYNIKYLFYYLEHNPITPNGYKRHFSDLRQTKIDLPHIEEQEKIANFLTALDDKIQSEENKIESTKKWKKGLLQRMLV